MTLATLILDSLYAGLLLIAAGWVLDARNARLRRPASRPRPAGPFADLDGRDRHPYAPHLASARERTPWPR